MGLGNGKQKMLFLPEPHTDFIYSIIGEEFGLIGATAVLAAFIFLFVRSVKVLKQQGDRFNFLLGAGLVASLLATSLHAGRLSGLAILAAAFALQALTSVAGAVKFGLIPVQDVRQLINTLAQKLRRPASGA